MIYNRYKAKRILRLSLCSSLAAQLMPVAHAASPDGSHFPKCPDGSIGTIETVHLNFAEASDIQQIVNLVDLNPEEDREKPKPARCGRAISSNLGSPNTIEIYGNPSGRAALKRLITSFDLPRQRINMDLWAIQISSASPAQLSEVMSQVQRQVDQTREAMQDTYDELIKLSLREENRLDLVSEKQLTDLGFGKTLSPDPTLSLTQLLLRLSLAENPIQNYNDAAKNICNFFAGEKQQKQFALYNRFEGRELESYDIQRIFNDDPPRPFRRPFQGFMEAGLHQRFDANSRVAKCGDGAITGVREALERENAARRRNAILNFAQSYYDFQQQPTGYDPDELVRTSGIVDGMVTPVVNAINQDIESYFIRPTLLKIRQIVGRNRGVEYAEFGRSTIAGINGKTVALVSGTTSTFDEPTPLRLSTWLEKAKTFKDSQATNPILPFKQPPIKSKGEGQGSPTQSTPPTENEPSKEATLRSIIPRLGEANLLSNLPLSNVIALLAALSQEEVKWQALSSGIQLKLTPKLMRDQMQATIKVDLAIADPAEMNVSSESNEPTVALFGTLKGKRYKLSDTTARPLSRISKSQVDTKVQIKTMDLFALSSFSNQTTITGRRWYVPLIGTIWEGAFGDVPVVGGWFSFKRPPQNKQHQSIILTNTLIVPSAMGMASYFKNTNKDKSADQLTIPSLGSQQLLEAIPRSKRTSPGSR